MSEHTSASIRKELGERGFISREFYASEYFPLTMYTNDGKETHYRVSRWERNNYHIYLYEYDDRKPRLVDHLSDKNQIEVESLGYININTRGEDEGTKV